MRAAVTTLLNTVTTSNYPNRAPQGTDLPYLVWYVIGNNPSAVKKLTPPVETARIQINIHAATTLAAETLAESVKAAINNFSGTVAGYDISQIWFSDENDGFDDNDQHPIIIHDYMIRINKSQS